MNGYGYEGISSYCQLTEKTTVSRTVYYDYLHIIDIVLRKLAIEICLEKLNEAKNQQIMYVGFDSSWAHRRDADHCLGILMDLKTNYIICFELVHHGKETEETLSSTDKHSKCMEGIALTQIIDRSQLNTIKNLTFVHDCDLSDHKLIEQMLPNAIIKFDPNHLCKKTKKIIAKVCQDDVDLRDLSEKIENYYSILIHERNISNEEKHEKCRHEHGQEDHDHCCEHGHTHEEDHHHGHDHCCCGHDHDHVENSMDTDWDVSGVHPSQYRLLFSTLAAIAGVKDVGLNPDGLKIIHTPEALPAIKQAFEANSLKLKMRTNEGKETTQIRIQQMDCPTEEGLIRKKLNAMKGVSGLQFNLMNRILTVSYPKGRLPEIIAAIKFMTSMPMQSPAPTQYITLPVPTLCFANASAVMRSFSSAYSGVSSSAELSIRTALPNPNRIITNINAPAAAAIPNVINTAAAGFAINHSIHALKLDAIAVSLITSASALDAACMTIAGKTRPAFKTMIAATAPSANWNTTCMGLMCMSINASADSITDVKTPYSVFNPLNSTPR